LSSDKKPSFLRKAVIALVIVLALGSAAYAFRRPLLTSYANWWVINEPVQKGDAILVLGGGLQYRTFAAANLYHAGVAPRILISSAEPSPTDELGLTIKESELMRQVLLKQRVPASAILMIGSNVTSTVEETLALRAWAMTNHVKRVLIPTEQPYTRRTQFIFRKNLAGSGAEPVITAIVPKKYQTTNWWGSEEGLIAFQNEFVKYLLYRWKY
jgi:uncharacterized SAM-binding protein YcdF (DUF218 family)